MCSNILNGDDDVSFDDNEVDGDEALYAASGNGRHI